MRNIKKTVSIYYNAKDATSKETMTIDEIIELIKHDSSPIITLTEWAREAEDKKQYTTIKRQLPMFTSSGIFSYRNDNPDNLVEYSNLFVVDFDHFHDHQKVLDFRKKLIEYADRLHIYALWISPSNDGIKAVMIHDNEDPKYHYNLFCQIKNKIYPRTVEFDMNCSDITRTCFICHDPDVWVNPRKDDIEPYHFEYDPSYPMSKEKDNSGSKDKADSGSGNSGRSSNSSEFIHTEDERNLNAEWQKQWKDKTLIDYADKGWRRQYPDSYKDGNRHLSILSRAKWLCLYGVLFENAKNYLINTFGRHGISEFEIEGMLRNNYHSNRGKFGNKRMEIYEKKEEGKAYRGKYLRGEV